MVLLPLLDLVSEYARQGVSPADTVRLARVTSHIVDICLAEWSQLRQMENDTMPTPWDDSVRAVAVSQSIYALYEQWARQVEEILRRPEQLASVTDSSKVEELEQALARCRARLQHTPEMQERAFAQVRAGQSIPAKELRDELHARIRAGRQVPVART